jgi:2-C-methyl-D-erythritol 4-phosphate cytidylyltransferase
MSEPLRVAVVVVAAGEGRRVGAGRNKVLLPLAGVPVLAWSLRTVQRLEYVDRVVVVIRDQDRPDVEATLREHAPGLDALLVVGGRTRHGSEWNALQALAPAIDAGRLDVVAVHDSARPLASPELFRAVFEAAAEHGGALPVHPQRSLVPREDPDRLPGYAGELSLPMGNLPWEEGERLHTLVNRHTPFPPGAESEHLVAVQTPQAFRAAPLLAAYRRAEDEGFTGTDTASCIERYTDLPIRPVSSPATNLKITFPEDVALAERLLPRLRRGGTS